MKFVMFWLTRRSLRFSALLKLLSNGDSDDLNQILFLPVIKRDDVGEDMLPSVMHDVVDEPTVL